MKKVLFAVALLLLLASTGRSQTVPHYIYVPQYIHVPSGPSKPWVGHSILSLHAGTGFFTRPDDGPYTVSDYSASAPFALSLRYSAEKDFAKTFYWGWYSGMNFYRYGLRFTYDGQSPLFYFPDNTSSAGHDVKSDRTIWAFSIEEGIVAGCSFTRALSLNLSAGLFLDLLSGDKNSLTYVNRTTGLVAYQCEDNGASASFKSLLGFSLRTELRYFVSGPCFVSLAVAARLRVHPGTLEDPLGTNQYAFMLGVGYKAFNKKSSFTDD